MYEIQDMDDNVCKACMITKVGMTSDIFIKIFPPDIGRYISIYIFEHAADDNVTQNL